MNKHTNIILSEITMQRGEILKGKNVIIKPCILSVGYISTNRKLVEREIGDEALVSRPTRRLQDVGA